MKELLMCCVIMAGLVACYYGGYQDGYKAGQLDTLLSQSQVQEIIGVKADGVVGPESRRVWDATIEQRTCDEAAVPIMQAFNKDFDRVCLNGMEFED